MAELLYFANPMCSWCWGFRPSLAAVRERWPELPVTVALGALDPGRASRPMGSKDKAYVREHWQRVRESSGQPFDFAFFEREGFVYDTEPACRAVAIVRRAYPALAFDFLGRLQELFYASNVDITDPARLREAAAEFGVDGESFDAAFGSSSAAAEVRREWHETARLGVTGYPTLVWLHGGRARLASLGWQPPAQLVAELERLGADRVAAR